MGLGLNHQETEVREVVTEERRKISFTQNLRNDQLPEGDSHSRAGGSAEREVMGEGEEEEEGGLRNKKRKHAIETESVSELEAVRENLAKVKNLTN